MTMLATSEKFPEQFAHIQQQFRDWPIFDQLYAFVELTRTFQLSYRHFLSQLFQSQILSENNDMFKHVVDDANAPDIVSCLLSNPLDKIIFTLQLYLPSISTTIINEKLLDAYRDVLMLLDSNLASPTKFKNCTKQQIIMFCQQILFFIQTNPILTRLKVYLPKLIQLVETKQFQFDEQQSFQAPLQRYSSIRSQVQTPKTNVSEEISTILTQQLTRVEINDSGVDLSEPSLPHSLQNYFSTCSFLDRTSNKHTFVGKTASSPIPEHGTFNVPARMPLKGVLSAPSTSFYSDARQKNINYQQLKHKSTLAKSDEDEESQPQMNESINEDNSNPMDSSRPLGQFYSLRYRNVKTNQNSQDVSQYLGVDGHSTQARNTFLQPTTGMTGVPKWLKNLRLHKYDVFFSQMTYDQMMNLNMEQLVELGITDGARTKILVNIKKLKERSTLLKQCLVDMDTQQIELANVILQLSEVLSTPIRSKQLELENNSDEDLPQLIMQILEKVNQQSIQNTPSSDICNNLLGLFDRCYRHEAFIDPQRYLLLQWRKRLSAILQSMGKIEFKKIQSTYNHTQPRREGKPPIRPMKSSSATYHQNYSSSSIPLSKFNSEPQHNSLMEPNFTRRPNRSPTQIYPTVEESNDNTHLQTSFTCLTSTPQRNSGAYLANNQHPTLTRKASIDPHAESTNMNNRTKLCKTFSDPNRIRFYNPIQLSHVQSSSSSIRPPQIQPTGFFQMNSTPYSQQQQRQFISRSPPSSLIDTSTSPIKECYPDDERSDYFDNPNNNTSISNTSEANELDNTDEQRQKHTEMESLCRQITESAMNDDVHESSIDHQENILDGSNLKQSSNHSTDTEQ